MLIRNKEKARGKFFKSHAFTKNHTGLIQTANK